MCIFEPMSEAHARLHDLEHQLTVLYLRTPFEERAEIADQLRELEQLHEKHGSDDKALKRRVKKAEKVSRRFLKKK